MEFSEEARDPGQGKEGDTQECSTAKMICMGKRTCAS